MNRRTFLTMGLSTLVGRLFPRKAQQERTEMEQTLLDAFWTVHKRALEWFPRPYVYEIYISVRPEYEDDVREQATWCIEMPLSQLEDNDEKDAL